MMFRDALQCFALLYNEILDNDIYKVLRVNSFLMLLTFKITYEALSEGLRQAVAFLAI